jgi:hypothetical protein
MLKPVVIQLRAEEKAGEEIPLTLSLFFLNIEIFYRAAG